MVADAVGDPAVVVVAADGGAWAYERPDVDLALADGSLIGDGATWDRRTGRSDDGRRLTRVPARRLYAFAWQDDHGPDSFFGLD